MPRARLIVDGYNVSKTAWPTLLAGGAAERLLTGLAPLVARTGRRDHGGLRRGPASTARPVVAAPRGVKVLFSPVGRDRRRRDPRPGGGRAAGPGAWSWSPTTGRSPATSGAPGARSVPSDALVALAGAGWRDTPGPADVEAGLSVVACRESAP